MGLLLIKRSIYPSIYLHNNQALIDRALKHVCTRLFPLAFFKDIHVKFMLWIPCFWSEQKMLPLLQDRHLYNIAEECYIFIKHLCFRQCKLMRYGSGRHCLSWMPTPPALKFLLEYNLLTRAWRASKTMHDRFARAGKANVNGKRP